MDNQPLPRVSLGGSSAARRRYPRRSYWKACSDVVQSRWNGMGLSPRFRFVVLAVIFTVFDMKRHRRFMGKGKGGEATSEAPLYFSTD